MADVDLEASTDGLADRFALTLRPVPALVVPVPALVVPVPALVVPVPAPIASLAAARLHFLCVAVHSLGGQHATAAEAARSCVSTRAESPRTSDPISGNLR